MQEDRFFILFSRKLSGAATSDELEELEEMLYRHPELLFFYHELIKPARRQDKELELAENSYISDVMNMQLQGVWDNGMILPEAGAHHQSKRKWYRIAVAAALVIVIGVGVILRQQHNVILHSTNETTTTRGSKSTVKLPDGTMVMLNANSSLKYDDDFKKDKREVILEGEAYFDVAHDAGRPFIIHTHTADIKVLGTVFNVRSFKGGYFETALIKGKVSVYLKNKAEGSFVLRPGQKLVVEDKENKSDRGTAGSVKIDTITIMDSLVAETSWTKDQLVFADKPLVDIAAELEKIFAVKIVFKSDKAKQVRYNGSYSDTDLNEILDIINMSKPIKYHREKDTIYID